MAAITDAKLDKFIGETRSFARQEDNRDLARQLKARLARAVDELIASPWRPLLFPSGKHPEEAYRFFNEPTETLYTVALAYPQLDAAAQEKARRFVASLTGPGGPLVGPTGRRVYDAGAGQVRSSYEHPPEKLMRADDGIVRSGPADFTTAGQVSGDWSRWKDWPELPNWSNNRPTDSKTAVTATWRA